MTRIQLHPQAHGSVIADPAHPGHAQARIDLPNGSGMSRDFTSHTDAWAWVSAAMATETPYNQEPRT